MIKVKRFLAKKLSNPRLYRIVYKSHNSLKREVLRPAKIIQIVQSVLIVVIIYWLTKNFYKTAFITVGAYLLTYVLVKGLWTIIQEHITNTGTRSKFSFAGKYFKKDVDGTAFFLATDGIETERFKFLSPSEAEEAGRLNHIAYSGGAWGTTLQDKIQRNKVHMERNDLCFMVITDARDASKHIGYSHVFPVSQRVWTKYCAGDIGDNDFKSSDIIPSTPSKDDQVPFGIIRFSLAIIDETEFVGLNHNEKLGDILEQAAAFHLKTLIDKYFSNSEKVPALLQNMDQNYFDFFKKYSKMNKISNDGAVIIDFEVWNSTS